MLPLGTFAPDFALTDTVSGKKLKVTDFAGKEALLVIFLCNHCPYVKHIQAGLAALGRDYEKKKHVGIVAISSNDPGTHPDDSPEKLGQESKRAGYRFPVLFDADQSVAKAYTAACTPDFFLFDSTLRLVYRGQFDASRPGKDVPVTGSDVRDAIDALLTKKRVSQKQVPSLGCNIKWKPGNEPEYFGP
jgi:peroxiredoxin